MNTHEWKKWFFKVSGDDLEHAAIILASRSQDETNSDYELINALLANVPDMYKDNQRYFKLAADILNEVRPQPTYSDPRSPYQEECYRREKIEQSLRIGNYWMDNNMYFCEYTLFGREMHFMATGDRMAAELERQGHIETFHVLESGDVVIEYDEDLSIVGRKVKVEDGICRESLSDYVRDMSQKAWFNLISSYEYNQYQKREIASVVKMNVEKYATV